MRKLLFSVLGIVLCLNAEQIVSTDLYFLGANGKNINYRYYIEDNSEIYLKVARGTENLDVIYGSIAYDYNMIAIGYYAFELYYKIPTNETLSSEYISKSVDPYMGIDLVMEQRSSDWTFGITIGLFEPPSLTYNWCCGETSKTDITGFTMGLKIGYTFGKVNANRLKKRNTEMNTIMQETSQGFQEYNRGMKQNNYNYHNTYQIPSYNQNRTKSTLYKTSHSLGCSSDISCGIGYSCVKPQYSYNGTCMKSVNKFGIQQFNTPRSNIGVNMKKQCTFDIQCPIGFKCISGNCIK